MRRLTGSPDDPWRAPPPPLAGAPAPGSESATSGREPDNLPALIARVTRQQGDARQRAGALKDLTAALAASARRAGAAATASGRWLTDVMVDTAPSLPIRDLPALRAAHGHDLAPDQLADALVAAAAKATMAVGAAAGALAGVEFAAPPALLAAPVQLAAETLAVVAIEVRLLGELHAVYGAMPEGTASTQAAAYLGAWARRRGVDPLAGKWGGITGGVARRELRKRLLRRAGRNAASFAPLLAGAVAAAELNRRETRALGRTVMDDLRRRGWR